MLAVFPTYEVPLMNGEQIARELGEITTAIRHSNEKIDLLAKRLELHIHAEEGRLKEMENAIIDVKHQLSFGRFILFSAKAVVLTVIFFLAAKTGDIAQLWKAIGK
jgi:formate-dependent nitrite reductase cytochrome c552 subunit